MHSKRAEIPFFKASCINASSLSLIIKKARGQFDKKKWDLSTHPHLILLTTPVPCYCPFDKSRADG